MGRIGVLAAAASEDALRDAGLLDDPVLTSGDTGIAYGSSGGSSAAFSDVAGFESNRDVVYLKGSTYVTMMPHTVPVNLSIFFGITGQIVPTSVACASGSMAIGYGRDMMLLGREKVMLCGGAEEFSPFSVGVFDALFDKSRDGIVVGEGAGTVILEEYESARARGANICAEVAGFASTSDATHITAPSADGMERCMRKALADAGLPPSAIGYVNGHGTGTELGDIAESQATARVFGDRVPFSAIKSYMGHTLGAAGALETIYSALMQREGWLAPNLNLTEPDPRCGELDYITGEGRSADAEFVMVNNFAFGGVNTSLILRKL